MYAAALALLTAMSFGQSAKLELSNIRGVYGQWGPPRKDLKVLPGELLYIAFDIGGLSTEKTGYLRFSSVMEVQDAKDKKPLYQKELGEVKFFNVLAGKKAQHIVEVPTTLATPPGKYLLKVTVTDLVGERESSFTQQFEVMPLDFGFVRFQFTYDFAAQIRMPNVGTLGQVLYVNAGMVGFKYDAKNDSKATITVEMTVLDEQGKPTASLPPAEFKDIPADTQYWHVGFDLPINRTGRFKIVLKATDHVSKKTATLSIPFQAVEAN